jgi:16S rRNA C1402 N4-methylase RsmH
MCDEALGFLKPRAGGIYVDATLGGGGHALKILTSAPGVRLIAIDQDAEAIARCKPILEPFKEQVSFVGDNFRNISEIVQREGLSGVDGILADIGLSTFQLESKARGFSFMKDARLDMRMDKTLKTTAYDLVNNLSASELERIFSKYGEERFSRRIVISFHSLEDRIVKRKFRELSRDCICPPRIPQCVCSHEKKLELLTRKVVKPTEIEVASNPRARSAKLRAAVRC